MAGGPGARLVLFATGFSHQTRPFHTALQGLSRIAVRADNEGAQDLCRAGESPPSRRKASDECSWTSSRAPDRPRSAGRPLHRQIQQSLRGLGIEVARDQVGLQLAHFFRPRGRPVDGQRIRVPKGRAVARGCRQRSNGILSAGRWRGAGHGPHPPGSGQVPQLYTWIGPVKETSLIDACRPHQGGGAGRWPEAGRGRPDRRDPVTRWPIHARRRRSRPRSPAMRRVLRGHGRRIVCRRRLGTTVLDRPLPLSTLAAWFLVPGSPLRASQPTTAPAPFRMRNISCREILLNRASCAAGTLTVARLRCRFTLPLARARSTFDTVRHRTMVHTERWPTGRRSDPCVPLCFGARQASRVSRATPASRKHGRPGNYDDSPAGGERCPGAPPKRSKSPPLGNTGWLGA
jgi:hypothetical protein